MSDWINEDMSEAKKTGGELPNQSAPRLVKELTPPKPKRKNLSC